MMTVALGSHLLWKVFLALIMESVCKGRRTDRWITVYQQKIEECDPNPYDASENQAEVLDLVLMSSGWSSLSVALVNYTGRLRSEDHYLSD